MHAGMDVQMYVCTYVLMYVRTDVRMYVWMGVWKDGCMYGKMHRYIDACFHASMHRSLSLCLSALSNLIYSYPIYTVLSYPIHLSTAAFLSTYLLRLHLHHLSPHLVSTNAQEQLLGCEKHIWLTFLQLAHSKLNPKGQ